MKLLIFLAFALAALAGPRDFSGSWTLNRQRSEIRPGPVHVSQWLRIEQQGAAVRCTTEAGLWSFTTDGKDAKQELGAESYDTAAKWEGDALLINALVGGPQNYTVMERWVMVGGGNGLTVRRQIVRASGVTESTLIYEREGVPEAATPAEAPVEYVVAAGTRIPLRLINSISTKQSAQGDKVYLETVFPIMVNGKIVIPTGSFVSGTVTTVTRPGRVKGKGELFLRFDTLLLANGVTRDFRSRMGGLDGDAAGKFDRSEGKVQSEGHKAGDVKTVGEAAAAGTSVGVIAGAAAGHAGMGAGIGAAAGAVAGLAGVLLSRGPDAVLAKGSTLELLLDRDLRYLAKELP